MLISFFVNAISSQIAAPLTTGSYLISNRNTGKLYLTAFNDRVINGPNRGDTTIEFAFVKQQDSSVLLRNGNLCGYVTDPDAGISLQSCPVTPNSGDKFFVYLAEDNQMKNGDNGVVIIKSLSLGKCLDSNQDVMKWVKCMDNDKNQAFTIISSSAAPAVDTSLKSNIFQSSYFLSAPYSPGELTYQTASTSWIQEFTLTPVSTRVYSIRSGNNCLFVNSNNVLGITACPSELTTNFMFRWLKTSLNSPSLSNIGVDMCLDTFGSMESNDLLFFHECLPNGTINQEVWYKTIPLPVPPVSNACTTPKVRREFRQLTDQEQKAYIDAVNCLKGLPSKIPGTRSTSRFDDAAYTHFQVMSTAHNSARFLVWHRAFLYTYERVLQTECGYSGSLPYWDWSSDSAMPTEAPILRAFGSDGGGANVCITTGPFANWLTSYGNVDCLRRNMYDSQRGLNAMRGSYSPESIAYCVHSFQNYDELTRCIEFGPHAGIHAGIGGSMFLLSQAANDPIFFSHHAMVDRLWKDWQDQNPEAGAAMKNSQGAEVVPPNTVLNMWGFTASGDTQLTAGEMILTTSQRLCYTYSTSVSSQLAPVLKKRYIENQLSCRTPLDRDYIILNRLNETSVRRFESELCKFIEYLNSDQSYKENALNATLNHGRLLPFRYSSGTLRMRVKAYQNK